MFENNLEKYIIWLINYFVQYSSKNILNINEHASKYNVVYIRNKSQQENFITQRNKSSRLPHRLTYSIYVHIYRSIRALISALWSITLERLLKLCNYFSSCRKIELDLNWAHYYTYLKSESIQISTPVQYKYLLQC